MSRGDPKPPADIDRLCADLGIGLKRRAKLSSEHGDDVIPYLQKLWIWAKAQDKPEYLHRHATAGTPDYVENEAMAMRGEEDLEERVPEEIQNRMTAASHHRNLALRAEEIRRRDVKSINQRLRELSNRSMRLGVDVTPVFEAVKRELAKAERQIKDAA